MRWLAALGATLILGTVGALWLAERLDVWWALH